MYLFYVDLYPIMKRILDVAVVLGMLVFLWPFFFVVALLVRWKMGAPILFSQDRPGRGGTLFRLYKFRSMRSPRLGEEFLQNDVHRLTDFGRFLRSTSLDELPELWNILRGDMSLVGPRPLLARQARRHEVRPGLTGWAQVNGRNAQSWAARFEYDVWYVEHCSLRLDLKILAMTLWTVISRKGVRAQGQATMSEFMGNE